MQQGQGHMLYQIRPALTSCVTKLRIESCSIIHRTSACAHDLLLLCGLYGDSHCPQQDPSQLLLVSRACLDSASAQHLDTIVTRSNSSLLAYSSHKRPLKDSCKVTHPYKTLAGLVPALL
eukprot:2034-Heterococcus_DN1.PRE.2